MVSPKENKFRRIASPLRIRRQSLPIESLPEIRKIDVCRPRKFFTKNLLARIQKRHLPSAKIKTRPFDESNASQQQMRILTRARKGPGRRASRQWKILYAKGPLKTRRRYPHLYKTRDIRYISLRTYQPSNMKNAGKDLDDIDTSWLWNYAIITEQRKVLRLMPRAERLLWPRMITSDMNIQQVLEAWQNIHPRVIKSRWQNYMLWALQESPEIALKSLDVTISYSIPKISRHIVEDCLDYLAAVFLKGVSSSDSSKLEYIYRLTCNFVKASPSEGIGKLSMNQQTVYLILAHCNNEQAENLYRIICNQNMELYSFTLLHFLRRFGDMGKRSLCVDVIQKITKCKIDLASDIVQSAFVRLLRTRYDENWYKFSTFILAESLRMGIRPRIFMYNTIILNSVDAGDYQTAFHIYKLAQENGLKPDAVTYGILLKGCCQSMDQESLDFIIHEIEADSALTADDDLIFIILYASLKIGLNRDLHSIFANLLLVYTKYFVLQPLQELGLVNIESPPQSLNPPSAKVLGIMLIAYIRQHSYSSETLLDLYQRYCDCVKQEHPLIAPIAATDHVANAFILAFGRTFETLEICTTIIKSMLEPQHENLSTAKSLGSSKVAGPTVYTWSILLMSFNRHHQMAAAEKVLSMMNDRGLEPNDVTWNNLVHGYALAQDIDGAMYSIKRMELEGYPIDNYTIVGLGKVKDRNLLITALNSTTNDDAKTTELQNNNMAEHNMENKDVLNSLL